MPMDYTYDALTQALQHIVATAQDVFIEPERIAACASHLRGVATAAQITLPAWADPIRHADEFPATNTLDTLQFFFVMITQGYQHYLVDSVGRPTPWQVTVAGRQRMGVHAQYACAMRALAHGMDILDPMYLRHMTLEDVQHFYTDEANGNVTLPDLIGRLARFHEVGCVLAGKYSGHYANLLAAAEGLLFRDDGRGIVQRLVTDFPLSYADWPFCKLAVTPSRMLHDRCRSEIPSSADYLILTEVRDPEHFEAGADVARPFALIRLGLLRTSPHLASVLMDHQPVGQGSRIYDELRAAAMLVSRELVHISGVPSPQLGGELWATGFYRCPVCRAGISDDELWCAHKPICHAYQVDHALFELGSLVGAGD